MKSKSIRLLLVGSLAFGILSVWGLRGYAEKAQPYRLAPMSACGGMLEAIEALSPDQLRAWARNGIIGGSIRLTHSGANQLVRWRAAKILESKVLVVRVNSNRWFVIRFKVDIPDNRDNLGEPTIRAEILDEKAESFDMGQEVAVQVSEASSSSESILTLSFPNRTEGHSTRFELELSGRALSGELGATLVSRRNFDLDGDSLLSELTRSDSEENADDKGDGGQWRVFDTAPATFQFMNLGDESIPSSRRR